MTQAAEQDQARERWEIVADLLEQTAGELRIDDGDDEDIGAAALCLGLDELVKVYGNRTVAGILRDIADELERRPRAHLGDVEPAGCA